MKLGNILRRLMQTDKTYPLENDKIMHSYLVETGIKVSSLTVGPILFGTSRRIGC
ncbi:MAG: hypothetical protein ACW98K_00575 [Candidatus Kariarchaeaceae archaeon]|jgi:hypothetical protein